MFRFALLSVILAVASAAPSYLDTPALPPVLLSKVNVAPTQLTVVKQPHVVTQPEPVYRDVPVPYKAVQYTAPQVVQPAPIVVKEPVSVHPIVQAPAPAVYAAPAPAPVVYTAPAPAPAPVVPYVAPAPALTYAAPASALTYAAPAPALTYAAAPAPLTYAAAPAYAYGPLAAPAFLKK